MIFFSCFYRQSINIHVFSCHVWFIVGVYFSFLPPALWQTFVGQVKVRGVGGTKVHNHGKEFSKYGKSSFLILSKHPQESGLKTETFAESRTTHVFIAFSIVLDLLKIKFFLGNNQSIWSKCMFFWNYFFLWIVTLEASIWKTKLDGCLFCDAHFSKNFHFDQ